MLAEVEKSLCVGALLVGGGHEVRDQCLEGGGIGAKNGGDLRLLHLRIHGGGGDDREEEERRRENTPGG